jgi:prevent-host-death family protein
VLTTNAKGAIAETKIAAAATELGISVLRPIVEHGRYDLAFEIGDRILRVQCKWAALDATRNVIKVQLQSSSCTSTGYSRRSYRVDEIDLLAIYCAANDRCYLLPSELVARRRAIWLRTAPPRNGQRACINLATDFEFPGAVAQLEERQSGTLEVRGSSPLSSTSSDDLEVGAHGFRNHFGWYLEQAAAGRVVRVSRRGQPLVQLGPCARARAGRD